MAEAGFVIDDKSYPIPTLDTINLDEERILFLYADTVLQDFMPVHPDWTDEEKRVYESVQMRKIRNPDFKRALAHIAYRRKNLDLDDAAIQEAIGKVNALEVDLAMVRGDDSPPAQSSQTPLESESNTSKPSRSTDSGSHTQPSSDQEDESPEPTGTIESETSSPGAPRIELVS